MNEYPAGKGREGQPLTVALFGCLPGSGETTLAKHLDAPGRGLRLRTDDWQMELGVAHADTDFGRAGLFTESIDPHLVKAFGRPDGTSPAFCYISRTRALTRTTQQPLTAGEQEPLGVRARTTRERIRRP